VVLLGSAGLLIGRDSKTHKLLRHYGRSHLLAIAPTRSGKGIGTGGYLQGGYPEAMLHGNLGLSRPGNYMLRRGAGAAAE